MNKLFAISLLIALCFQLTLKLGIVAWYNANKQYVSTTLCENRAKPQMKCNGKCYLRKQLNKADKQGSQSSSNNQQTKSQQTEISEFVPVSQVTFCYHLPAAIQQHHDGYKAPNGTLHSVSIFHPPPVA